MGDLPTDPTSWSADLGVEIFNTNRSRLASWGMVSPRFCVAVAYLTVSYEVTLGCSKASTNHREEGEMVPQGTGLHWPPGKDSAVYDLCKLKVVMLRLGHEV